VFNRQMVKFSTAAKLTQARYGSSSYPAIFELRKKATVVATITSRRITILAKASLAGAVAPSRSTSYRYTPLPEVCSRR
jgi:hypothetical protein